MADTVFVNVPLGSWVLILAANSTALISNEGGARILIVEAASLPAASSDKGHSLNQREKVTRTTPAGQEIYAFGVSASSFVAVTAA